MRPKVQNEKWKVDNFELPAFHFQLENWPGGGNAQNTSWGTRQTLSSRPTCLLSTVIPYWNLGFGKEIRQK
jgi:hypothetical protein